MAFEAYYSSIPDVNAYLDRIGIEAPKQPDLAYLQRLIYRHQCSIPFENIDIRIRHLDVSLTTEAVFNKVVRQGRGGYCFELNNLFYYLLKALGYNVTPCLNKVAAFPSDHYISMHRGSVVHMDGRDYYCDIGFGGPIPAGPLLIEEDLRQTFAESTYRLTRYSDTLLSLIRTNSKGQDEVMILINPAPFDPVDFVPLSHYLCCDGHTDFELQFQQNLMLNIRTESGYASIMNTVMKQECNGVVTITDVSDTVVLLCALHEVFHLPDTIDSYFD